MGALRYHKYIIPDHKNLKDSILHAYRAVFEGKVNGYLLPHRKFQAVLPVLAKPAEKQMNVMTEIKINKKNG